MLPFSAPQPVTEHQVPGGGVSSTWGRQIGLTKVLKRTPGRPANLKRAMS